MNEDGTLRAGVVELTKLAQRLQSLSLATEREALRLGEHLTARGDPLSTPHPQLAGLHSEIAGAQLDAARDSRVAAPRPNGTVAGDEAGTLRSGDVELSELAERLQSLSLATEREAVRLGEHLTAGSDLVSTLRAQLEGLQSDLASARREADDLRAEADRVQAEAGATSSQLAAAQRELEATTALLAAAERARDGYARYLVAVATSGPGRVARHWLDFRRDHTRAARLIRLPLAAWMVLTLRRPRWLRQHPLFDEEWYLDVNPGVRDYRFRPWWHYVRHGMGGGRAPNAYFDQEWYLRTYPDVRRSGLSPLDHYYRHGCWEGRDPSPRFATDEYLALHPEVAAAGVNPLWHYLRHGKQGSLHVPAADSGADAGASGPSLHDVK